MTLDLVFLDFFPPTLIRLYLYEIKQVLSELKLYNHRKNNYNG